MVYSGVPTLVNTQKPWDFRVQRRRFGAAEATFPRLLSGSTPGLFGQVASDQVVRPEGAQGGLFLVA